MIHRFSIYYSYIYPHIIHLTIWNHQAAEVQIRIHWIHWAPKPSHPDGLQRRHVPGTLPLPWQRRPGRARWTQRQAPGRSRWRDVDPKGDTWRRLPWQLGRRDMVWKMMCIMWYHLQLVGGDWNMFFLSIYCEWSPQLTNSYFSEGYFQPPTRQQHHFRGLPHGDIAGSLCG